MPAETYARSGLRPSVFDPRDLTVSALGINAATAPPSVALPDPYAAFDQGEVPCCVSSAVCTAMESLDAASPPGVRLAPLFSYYTARNDPRWMTELTPRDVLSAAAHAGVCAWDLHAITSTRDGAGLRPSAEAYADAQNRRIAGPNKITWQYEYRSLDGADPVGEWRGSLAAGYPIVAGLWLTPGYWAMRNAATNTHPLDTGVGVSGHAVAILGYDDGAKVFLAKDSRGPTFGTTGRWWFPYALVNSRLIIEAWNIRRLNY